jgi:hypothetical protein
MKPTKQIGIIVLIISFALVACKTDTKDNKNNMLAVLAAMDQQTKAAEAAKKCETRFDFTSSAHQLVCTPASGKGRHFRLEGLKLSKTENPNGAFYFLMGQDSSVIGTTTTPSAAARTGNGKFSFYHYVGSFTGSAPYGVPYIYYTDGVNAAYLTSTGTSTGSALYNSFVEAETTLCFDVSASTPPRVTVWVNGINGVNCSANSTLTASSAVWSKSDWSSSFAISDSGVVTIKSSSSTGVYLSKIIVSSETAIK